MIIHDTVTANSPRLGKRRMLGELAPHSTAIGAVPSLNHRRWCVLQGRRVEKSDGDLAGGEGKGG